MESYTKPTVTSCNKFLKNHQSFPYRKGKSLKDMLVRAKKKRLTEGSTPVQMCGLSPFCTLSHNRFVSILAIIPAGSVLYNKCSQLSHQQLVPIYVIKQGDPPPKGSGKLHDPPLAQGSKPHDPPPLCSGPPPLYFLTSPLYTFTIKFQNIPNSLIIERLQNIPLQKRLHKILK